MKIICNRIIYHFFIDYSENSNVGPLIILINTSNYTKIIPLLYTIPLSNFSTNHGIDHFRIFLIINNSRRNFLISSKSLMPINIRNICKISSCNWIPLRNHLIKGIIRFFNQHRRRRHVTLVISISISKNIICFFE